MGKQQKPNILIIMSDQHGAWASGPYGHPFVQTPNLDRLAQQGIVFDSAYCNSPLCGPCRASFLTGKLPHHIEAWENFVPLSSEIPTWAHALTIAGYQTVLAGKQHFAGPDQTHGFEQRLGGEVHTTRIVGRVGDDLKLPDDFFTSWYKQDTGRTFFLDYDDDMANKAVSFLQGEGRDPERPFALCVSFISPHPPVIVEEEYFNMYWPEHGDLPQIPEGYLEKRHPVWNALTLEHYGPEPFNEEQIRRARAAYYGLCTFTDKKVGQVIEALNRAGLAEDTIVVYISDHGEFAGSRGMWGKSSFFEEAVKVPLIISWPGHFPENKCQPEVVSLIDLTATILEWADAPALEDTDGQSFNGLLKGEEQSWPNVAISEYYDSTQGSWRMIRRGRFKLNYFLKERPELFDLEADPGELNDLATNPEYAGIVKELTALVTKDWDVNEVQRRYEESGRRRAFIFKAEQVYKTLSLLENEAAEK